MRVYFRWLSYAQPVSFGFEALLSNEFRRLNVPCAQLAPSGTGYEALSSANQVASSSAPRVHVLAPSPYPSYPAARPLPPPHSPQKRQRAPSSDPSSPSLRPKRRVSGGDIVQPQPQSQPQSPSRRRQQQRAPVTPARGDERDVGEETHGSMQMHLRSGGPAPEPSSRGFGRW
ncbi:ATP-binding cassette transporter snq2 [Rhodotorula kratochvilovae]